jgi:hypothetical protein
MSDQTAGSPAESLQFDRAVDADAPDAQQEKPTIECSACHAAIKTYYYNVDANAVCAKCKHVAEKATQGQRGASAFLKAFFFGGFAALIGALIYFGVAALTGYEIGLVAIAIGFMVGFAVRFGANGGGGRRFQVLALVLTYFAVGLAYTGIGIQQTVKDAGKTDAQTQAFVDSILAAQADGSDSDADADNAADDALAGDSMAVALAGEGDTASVGEPKKLGPLAAVLGLAIVAVGGFIMVFALPILAIVSDMPGGLISALIIGFGLMQAWKMTGGTTVSITGPYKVGGAPPEASTEPAPAA